MRPNGGHRGMAALRNYTTHRPRVNQVSSENYVLYQNIIGIVILCIRRVVWCCRRHWIGRIGGGLTHRFPAESTLTATITGSWGGSDG